MNHKFSDILLKPLITEKSTVLSQKNKYTFCVPLTVTKPQIKNAFNEIFPDRKISSIKTLKIRGHKKRTKSGFKSPRDLKKAIISFEGAKIEYFPEAT